MLRSLAIAVAVLGASASCDSPSGNGGGAPGGGGGAPDGTGGTGALSGSGGQIAGGGGAGSGGVDTGGEGGMGVAGGGGGVACDGPVHEGSFEIHAAADLAILAGYAQVTGDVIIEGPGVFDISLPQLCLVGGSLYNTAGVLTLDLPGLVQAGGLEITGEYLTGVNLESLAEVTTTFSLAIGTSIELPSLTQVGSFALQGPGEVDAPILASAGTVSLVCSGIPECPGSLSVDSLPYADGILVAGFHVSAAQLATAVDLYTDSLGSLGLGALTTITGSASLWADDSTVNLPELESIGGNLSLTTIGPNSMSFPKLSSIGGDASVEMSTGATVSLPLLSSVSGDASFSGVDGALTLPSLTSVGGDLYVWAATIPASVSLPGLSFVGGAATIGASNVSAPAVTTLNGLALSGVQGVDFSSLQSVGAPDCAAGELLLWQSPIATLQLPALTFACLKLASTCGPSFVVNQQLTQIVAPNLTGGRVQFWGNPMLPQCRADALAAQIVSPLPGNNQQNCLLAAGPCP